MYIDKQRGDPGAAPATDTPSRITFRLDSASGVPTYLQLVHQVEQALQLGYLARGDQLPRVKDVVGTLAINPNTVLKAYRELEHRGIAAGRPGQGTFVEAAPEVVPLAEMTGLRKGLLGWLQDTMLAEANIGHAEFGLISVVDEPGEVVDIIRQAHAGQAPGP